MLITFLHGLQIFFIVAGILAVSAVLLIGGDLAYYEYKTWRAVTISTKKTQRMARAKLRVEQLRETAKERLRKKKEEEAWEGFFETTYIRGFENNGQLRNHGVRVPSRTAHAYFAMMEELAQKVSADIKREASAADQAVFDNTKEL